MLFRGGEKEIKNTEKRQPESQNSVGIGLGTFPVEDVTNAIKWDNEAINISMGG